MTLNNTIYIRNSTRVFLVMNARGEYYGPGGWVEEEQQARQFCIEDALQMLKVFPNCSAVSAVVRPSRNEVPEFEGTAA